MSIRDQQIIEMYLAGRSYVDIAKELGVTKGVVSGVIDRTTGIQKRKATARENLGRNARIVKLYREGMTSPEIADGMSMTAAAAANVIHEKIPEDERKEIMSRRRVGRRTDLVRVFSDLPDGREALLNAVITEGRNLANFV